MGSGALNRAQIQRIDFAVDYDIPMNDMRMAIDVVNKQKVRLLEAVAGDISTVRTGKGDEVITLYDRRRLRKSSSDRTRIEVSIKGKYLPTEYVANLPKTKNLAYTAMGNVRHYALSFSDLSSLASEKQRYRLIELKTALGLVGYAGTVRYLNKHQNFHRTYGDLMQRIPVRVQPWSFLDEALKHFFGVDAGK